MPTPADLPRWRALQNVVLALAHLGRSPAAAALLLAQELPAAAHGSKTGAQLPAGSRTVQMSRDPEAEGKAADTKARADGLKAEITKRAARK